MNPARHLPWLVGVLLVLFSAWFVAAYYYKAANAMLLFDSAWHASVAKNLVQGPGYASSYDGYRFFDPDVTTGPVPIGLAAAAIAVFGNHYALPHYVAGTLHLCLALGVVYGIYRAAGRTSAIICAVSIALLLSFFESFWWQLLTGDMSALLLGILGLQFTVRGMDTGSRATLVGAGGVLALSLLSKSVGVMFLAAGGAYVILAGLRHRTFYPGALLTVAATLLVCLLPWKIYQSAAEVPPADHERVVVESALTRNVVGIVQLWEARDKIAQVKKSVAISNTLFNRKLASYGLPDYTHLLFFAVSLGLLVYTFVAPAKRGNQLLLALCLAAVAYWSWHLLLSVSLEQKYTLYPLFLSVMVLLYWLSITRLRWLAPPLVLAWMLGSPVSAREEAVRFFALESNPDNYRQSLAAVAAEAAAIESDPSSPPLAACGWMSAPWSLEYLMPGSNHFMDCYQHLARAMERDPTDGSYRWRSGADLGFTLVVDNSLWAIDSLNRDRNSVILEVCGDQQQYRNDHFQILRCRDEALRARIRPAADSPFLEPRRPGS